MTPRLRLFGIIGLVLAGLVIGNGCYRWLRERAAAVHIQKADQLDTSQATHGTQAVTHEQEAEALKPVLQQDEAADASTDAAAARSRTAMERLRPGHPRQDPPQGPAAPTAQLLQAPVELAALDAAKDQLIGDLTAQVAAVKKHNADLQAALQATALADQARAAQVADLQGEVKQLRAAYAARPRTLRWAVSGIYGTNQTLGAGVEYDVSVVRAGIDIVRRQVNGGQTTLEAVGRLGLRF